MAKNDREKKIKFIKNTSQKYISAVVEQSFSVRSSVLKVYESG